MPRAPAPPRATATGTPSTRAPPGFRTLSRSAAGSSPTRTRADTVRESPDYDRSYPRRVRAGRRLCAGLLGTRDHLRFLRDPELRVRRPGLLRGPVLLLPPRPARLGPGGRRDRLDRGGRAGPRRAAVGGAVPVLAPGVSGDQDRR